MSSRAKRRISDVCPSTNRNAYDGRRSPPQVSEYNRVVKIPAALTQNRRFLTAVGILQVFGAFSALLFGFATIWPDALFRLNQKLNPPAQIQLNPLGKTVGILLLVLAVARGLSAVGWFRWRRWGWLLTTILIAIQIPRDAINVMSGNLAQGLFGAVVASALLFYLLQPEVRSAFRSSP
jgi:hypothetical protein